MNCGRGVFLGAVLGLLCVQVNAQNSVSAAARVLQVGESSAGEVRLAIAVLCTDSDAAKKLAVSFSNHEDWSRRRTGAFIWSGLGPTAVLANAVLLHALHEDRSWPVREATYQGLSGGEPSDESWNVIRKGLSDAVWRVRLAALKVFGRWPIDQIQRIEPSLILVAKDPDPNVRRTAIQALCKYGASRSQTMLILRSALLDRSMAIPLRRACWLRLNESGVAFDEGLEADGTLRETLLAATLANVQRIQSPATDSQLIDLICHPEARHVLGERIMGLLVRRLSRGQFVQDDLMRGLKTEGERALCRAVLDQPMGDWPVSALRRDLALAHVTGAELMDVLIDEIPSEPSDAVRAACRGLLFEDRRASGSGPRWLGRVFDCWSASLTQPDIAALKKLMEHSGRSIRRRAVVALTRSIARSGRNDILTQFLAEAEKEELLLAAVGDELAKKPSIDYLTFFLTLAQSPSGIRARLSGVRGLESLRGPIVVEAIHDLLKRTPYAEVQMFALSHLLSIGDESAMGSLLARFHNLSGQPSLDDVRLMGMAAPDLELARVIKSFIRNGRFADRSLPGMLDALKRALPAEEFSEVATRAVLKGISSEHPVLSGNTARHLMLRHNLVDSIEGAMRAFEAGHIRISESLLEGICELALASRRLTFLKPHLTRYYRDLGQGLDNSEKRSAVMRSLVRIAGVDGRALVQERVAVALESLAGVNAVGGIDLCVANEVVEGLSALLDHGGVEAARPVLEHIATFIEQHVERRLVAGESTELQREKEEQLLQLLIVGFSSGSLAAVDAGFHDVLSSHPVAAAFMAHQLLPGQVAALGPRSGWRAPCMSIARLALSQASVLSTIPTSSQLVLIRCLLDRNEVGAAALALQLVDSLERWRLVGSFDGVDRSPSFLRMRPALEIAFDPQPIAVARAIAHLQIGHGVKQDSWDILLKHGEWDELLVVIRQLRRSGSFECAGELLALVLPYRGRHAGVLFESVKLLISEGRRSEAASLAARLGQRLSVAQPAVAARFLLLQATASWSGDAQHVALDLLHAADQLHPSGAVDLKSDAELLGWMDGLTSTEWYRNRNR